MDACSDSTQPLSCGTSPILQPRRRPKTLLPTIVGVALLPALIAGFAASARGDVYIDKKYPIQGTDGVVELSPPNIEPTNECATYVYVNSFIPKATIKVYLGGTALIGSATPQTGFVAIHLTHQLHPADKVTATQTVNSVTSAQSADAIIGTMPAKLPAPTISPNVYACGRVVPVESLLSGVTVTLKDVTASMTLGTAETPNNWGSDWAPVGTAALTANHKLTATQSACGGQPSPPSSAVTVLSDPAPMTKPTLVPPVVGNDTVAMQNLYTGAQLEAENTAATPPGNLGGGFATGSNNWMELNAPIAANETVSVDETLCKDAAQSSPQKPLTTLEAPLLLGPICPGQAAVTVRNSTPNATLVLLENGKVVGYGGAAPGDVPLTVAPPNKFVLNDTVEVIEYIGGTTSQPSNSVKVGCTNAITYHYDNQRTGWNDTEQVLTAANVGSPQFGLLQTVALDDQVDAQPLLVTQQTIKDQGVHDVVYVATENNTIYVIDILTGSVLLSQNFGTPVPQSALPGTCGNNTVHVGINSTPVVDLASGTMYVIIYTYENNTPIYRIHALDLQDLVDKVQPVVVTASHKLSDGSTFSFQPQSQRQRSALLAANGNIYAGFASFCDINANVSRGWLLGWKAGTLTPLAANELTDQQTVAQTPPNGTLHNFFLSSIWMSGYGVAADSTGDLYFVTGNSDTVRTDNIQESAVRMSSDLTTVKDYFTPSNFVNLDNNDMDYGSGGLLVLPDQPAPVPHLAVAAGKDGRLFIINRDDMGKYVAGGPDVPRNVNIVWCHCGQSYFVGSDGIARVVSSGDTRAKTWKIDTSKPVALSIEGTSQSIFVSSEQSSSGLQDSGFFTTISSNGKTANSAVIWAVSRPDNAKDPTVSLYAFNAVAAAGALPKLFSGTAGTWPAVGGNANIVPVVANGRVYVASYKQLAIFGLSPPTIAARAKPRAAELQVAAAPAAPPLAGSHFAGTIESVNGDVIVVRLRSGDSLTVDLTKALNASDAIVPFVGEAVMATGTLTTAGVLDASTMLRGRGLSALPADSSR